MAKFAKLIELDNEEQVLLTISYNDDKNVFEASVRTDLDGFVVQVTFGFSEGHASEFLEHYSKEQAIAFRREMKKTLQ